MEKLKELLDNAYNMEKIFRKIKQEPKKEIYLELLEDLEEKEQKIMSSLRVEELETLKNIFINRYGLTFDGLFLPKYFLEKELPLCLLRVYHLIFDEVEFQQLQQYSNINREEANEIIGMPYINELKKKDEMIHEFENILLINAISLKEEERFFLVYLYYTKEMDKKIKNIKKLQTKEIASEKIWNKTKDIILFDIQRIMENMETNFEENLRLIQNYFITTDPLYHEDIKDKIKENIKLEHINIINRLLSTLKIAPIKMEEVKGKKKEETKIYQEQTIFNANELIKFQELYQTLTANSLTMWTRYLKIVESKKKKEEENKREYLYELLEETRIKEENILKNIENIPKFQDFETLFYSTDDYSYPFYNIYIANVINNNTLESKEAIINFVRFRLTGVLEKYQKEQIELQDENTYFNTTLIKDDEEKEEKSVHIIRLEKIIEALIKYNLNITTEETLIETLGELNFELEDENFISLLDVIYQKYSLNIKKYMNNHPYSKYNSMLYNSLYALYFIEEDIKEMIKNDFEVPLIEEELEIELTNETKNMLKEYLKDILDYSTETLKITPGMNLSLSLYRKALKSILKEKDIKELKDCEIVKRLKRKN